MAESSTDGTGARVRLVETVAVASLADGVALVRGRDMLRLSGDRAGAQTVTELLRAGVTHAELLARRPDAEPLLSELSRRGWLTDRPPLDDGCGGPWARQLGYLSLFGPDVRDLQRRISSASVAVVGVGGVGSLLAQHLVAAGVARLALLDPDRVAEHNLNRQYLFGVDDIGDRKVDAAERALQRINPAVQVRPLARRIGGAADLDDVGSEVSLLVVAADTPPTIMDVCWEWAAAAGVPTTTAGVGLGTGYWGPLLDPRLGDCWPCFRDRRRERLSPLERELELVLSAPSPYSTGPSNSAVTALLANDVQEYLATGTCPSTRRRVVLDLRPPRIAYHPDAAAPPDGGPCLRHSGGRGAGE